MTADAAQRLQSQIAPAGSSETVVMRLSLIGQMEAWTVTSENVLPAGRKTRALLAVVALRLLARRYAAVSRSCCGAAGRRSRHGPRCARKSTVSWRRFHLAAPRSSRSPAIISRYGRGLCGWMSRRCCGRRLPSRLRCRSWTGTCSRISTGWTPRSTPGSPRNANECATGLAVWRRRCCGNEPRRKTRFPRHNSCFRSTARMRAPGGR